MARRSEISERHIHNTKASGKNISAKLPEYNLLVGKGPCRRVHGGLGQTSVWDTLVTSQPSGLIRYFCL